MPNEDLKKLVDSLARRVEDLERSGRMSNRAQFFRSYQEASQRYNLQQIEPTRLNSLYVGYVVDVKDPWKIQRVKVFVPFIHDGVPDADLPWANAGTAQGSLDETGRAGVPSEGSTVYVMFEMGDRFRPVYMGGVWNVTREADVPFEVQQEQERWGASRFEDHNPEANPDQKQLMPPWNNESYGGPDAYVFGNPEESLQSDSAALKRPHIHGWKTPEKHFLQFADGSFEDGLKGKRVVLQSSRGNVLFMKDDVSQTSDEIFANKYWDDLHDRYPGATWRVKPFNDHRIELPHTGFQLQSVAGARVVVSDEAEGLSPDNKWDAGWRPRGRILSSVSVESVTENLVYLSDRESETGSRGVDSGVFLRSSAGHVVQMIDHSDGTKPGSERKIRIWSTGGHLFEMNDASAEVEATDRASSSGKSLDGVHATVAPDAYVLLRSTVGHRLIMHNSEGVFLVCSNESFVAMHQKKDQMLFETYASGRFHTEVVGRATYHYRDVDVSRTEGNSIKRTGGYYLQSAVKNCYYWSRLGRIFLLTGAGGRDALTRSALQVAVGPTAYCANFRASRSGYPHYLPAEGVFASLTADIGEEASGASGVSGASGDQDAAEDNRALSGFSGVSG